MLHARQWRTEMLQQTSPKDASEAAVGTSPQLKLCSQKQYSGNVKYGSAIEESHLGRSQQMCFDRPLYRSVGLLTPAFEVVATFAPLTVSSPRTFEAAMNLRLDIREWCLHTKMKLLACHQHTLRDLSCPRPAQLSFSKDSQDRTCAR